MSIFTKQAFQRLIKQAVQLVEPSDETHAPQSSADCTDKQTHPHSSEDTSEQPSDTSR